MIISTRRRVILPLQSAIQPLVLRAPLGVRNYSIFEDWKGSSAEEHIRKRSEKGDTDDVHSEAWRTVTVG
jgi:hypothetical protein